jgi:hypothetical protein
LNRISAAVRLNHQDFFCCGDTNTIAGGDGSRAARKIGSACTVTKPPGATDLCASPISPINVLVSPDFFRLPSRATPQRKISNSQAGIPHPANSGVIFAIQQPTRVARDVRNPLADDARGCSENTGLKLRSCRDKCRRLPRVCAEFDPSLSRFRRLAFAPLKTLPKLLIPVGRDSRLHLIWSPAGPCRLRAARAIVAPR